uniref:NBS-LRR disease resistance protein n=1 Tax=Dasypyrum villosum TaxID=40247 RepID=A0A8K1IAX9_9POAL|nr:NBS-LRR disease resistance protein [Dasypyrum villosum]
MDALLGAAQWVVGKALAPVADGVLEVWGATNNLGLNIEALKMELLLVKATLETASRKHIDGQAMEELLGMLRDSAHCAEDLLGELDYFRIHDELQGTCNAVDYHAKGGVHDLALNAPHAAKGVRKLLDLSTWSCKKRLRGNSSSTPSTNQDHKEDNGRMPKLGKLLPCSSSPHVHDHNTGQSTLCGALQREHTKETPMLVFNRVNFSERMKHIVEQLKPVRKEIIKILQCCDRMTVPDIAQSRPITTGYSIEPKLYGRDHIMSTIIHDMTKGKYHKKDLSVLPFVGPGGIGKTTLVQHIYRNQQVQGHFQLIVWVCVSLSFNLNKLLEEIKTYIPRVEGEKEGRVEELIEQRIKSKRFLLVLDDVWECSNEDDWERLLLPLKTSQEKGCVILVTNSQLFHAFVFGDDHCTRDQFFLLQTGDKIMIKLKGSPLAAKSVGRLLRKDLSLRHWRRILESKEWERLAGVNHIMPALKLSYDYLPFHLQQCFAYSALFPEDFHFSSSQLINLWIGLDILQPAAQNQTFKDIGLSNLNELVMHGFFREEETNGHLHYVMHDLLHDLALQVASHNCMSLHHSNMGLVEIQPSIRHLSIIIDDNDTMSYESFKSRLRKLKIRLKVKQLHTFMLFGEMNESITNIFSDWFREANDLRVLHLVKMSSTVESMLHNFPALVHLRYLCLGTKNNGRDMHLPSTIPRFYHLRILDLGSWCCRNLPEDLSNLGKLRHLYTESDELHSDIVNVGKLTLLEELKVFRVNKKVQGFEPKQLGRLTELRQLGIYNLENIHTKEEAAEAKLMEKNYLERLTLDWDSKRSNTEPGVEAIVLESLQPHIYLQELCIRGHGGPACPTWLGDKLGVEALQSIELSSVSWEYLPHFGKMWGLGKVRLEHIYALVEFVIEQSFCRLIRLELVGLGCFEKWVPSQEAADHMFPLLQVLIIRDCPILLELPFSNHFVEPKLDQDWNIDWFPKLQELEIKDCPELLLVARIPWTETMCLVNIRDIKLLENFEYKSKSSYLHISGKGDLQSLDEVVAFHNMTGLEKLELFKCPPLHSKQLLQLTSLNKLFVYDSDCVVGLLEREGDVEWQNPLEDLTVEESCEGKELTELLTHLTSLSELNIMGSENITKLAVGVTTSAVAIEVEQEKEDDELLLFPTHLSYSLQELLILGCPDLVLVDPPSSFLPAGGGGGFQALWCLRKLKIWDCPKILSARSSFSSPSCCLFPSYLQELFLRGVEGMGNLEPLSNLTSLTLLELDHCGEDLTCRGLEPLLTAGGQLRQLKVTGSPGFFVGWDPNPRRVLQDERGEEQDLQQHVFPPSSSKLQELSTDETMGLLTAPICSFLSSSLSELQLIEGYQEIEGFTKEQEDALHLLTSLQNLKLCFFRKIQSLPRGLHKLTNLKSLDVLVCPAVKSLPKDGLPKSLRKLDVSKCGNEELKRHCRALLGTIPEIFVHRS